MFSIDTLETVTKVLWIIFPISAITSIFVFIYVMYKSRRKRQTFYLFLIKVIAFNNIPFCIQANVVLFFPESMKLEMSHRILTFVGGWSGFIALWFYLICDMELLKLLHIITPYFTPNRIIIIQIIETVICFCLGGGVLIWPFSDLNVNGFISMWYNFIVLQQLIAAVIVTIQCVYISLKMYQFATQKKGKDGEKVRKNTYKAIMNIFIFFTVCISCTAITFIGVLVFSDTSPISRRLNNLMLASSCVLTPFQILAYHQLFDSIVGIKFERILSKKHQTVQN